MDGSTGAWFALIGFVGTAAGFTGFTKSHPGTKMRFLSSVVLILGCFASLVMVLQGLHLRMQGWNPGPIDSKSTARIAVSARGKGGILVMIAYFFPQFLVFGNGAFFAAGAKLISIGLNGLPRLDLGSDT